MNQDTSDEWGRLTRQPDAGNRAGLYMQGGELRRHGIDPSTLGLLDLGAAIRAGTRHVEIPVVERMALSLTTSTEVRLIRPKANEFRRNHPVAGEGVFPEAHPADWISALAEFDQSLLVITAKRPREFKTTADWMLQWHVGLVPVAYRMDFNGFSMHPETVEVERP